MSGDEKLVVTKVEELMKSLDQVKKYRALARLMLDFSIIMLISVALLLMWELSVNLYKVETGSYCYYATPGLYTCTAATATGSPLVQLFAGLSFIVIPAAGLLTGIFWVDHRLKLVKVGEWKESLREGFPGAIKLLQDLKWDAVFEDIRLSKIGYALYFTIKIVGYWLLAFFALSFPYALGISALHLEINLYVPAFLSLVLVLVLSRGDLQRRYQQVVSLDTLMWDLRWFSSGFRTAKFET